MGPSSGSSGRECRCAHRRRLESRLPVKHSAILVMYLCSMVLATLALVMFGVGIWLEDRSDFHSVLALWGVNSKHVAYVLLLLSLVTPLIDKLQRFWIELEVSSKAHLFHVRGTAFSRNSPYVNCDPCLI